MADEIRKADLLRLYLLRHGETVANREHRYMGSSESSLTESGELQQQHALLTLKNVNASYIYTSPRQRCLSLAQKLAQGSNAATCIDKRVAEYHFGIFELMTWQEAKNLHPEVFKQWQQSPQYALPKGESRANFEHRVFSFSEAIVKGCQAGDVIIVTHAGVIRLMLTYLLKMNAEEQWRFMITNGSLTKLCIQDGFAYLEL